MDIGLYRDQQFPFRSSSYSDCYSSDLTSYSGGSDEFLEDIRPMPQPPSQLFEWSCDEMEKDEDNVETLNPSEVCNPIGTVELDPVDLEELPSVFGITNNWKWQSSTNARLDYEPISVEPIPLTKNDTSLQEILELPEIASLNAPTLNTHLNSANNGIINYDNRIALVNRNSCDVQTSERTNCRRESESSDILNASFSSTELTNFDITEYVFMEDKQTKKSTKIVQVKNEPECDKIFVKKEQTTQYIPTNQPEDQNAVQIGDVNIKQEPLDEPEDIKPAINNNIIPKRTIKAGRKKIDLKARRYIVEVDVKKSVSEDECDIDIETVSEEEGSAVLQAGTIGDLFRKFESTQEVNKDKNSTVKNIKSKENSPQHKMSLNVKVDITTDNVAAEERMMKPLMPKMKLKQEKNKTTDIKPVKLEQEKPKTFNTKVKIEPPALSSLPSSQNLQQLKAQPVKSVKTTAPLKNKSAEPTTSSSPPNVSNKQILDLLPQEVINRIKECGKRKPVTVIEPIPNIRKKSRNAEPITGQSACSGGPPNPAPCPATVHLDHNYCSNKDSPSNQVSKKDSGFVSSEEDDKSLISRQPTVRNADGTIMVSLLKSNTIHTSDSAKKQKKKLNLEEYLKRRNGLITPKDSRNCSPSVSTCSSPVPEDDHQKMLKHQEKLRKMAQEVLNAAPKLEKKPEPNLPLVKVPTIFPIPISPASSSTISQPGSPAVKQENGAIKSEPLECIKQEVVAEKRLIDLKPPKLPANLERKVLVSFGVNTDFRIGKNENALAPVVKLQEMKPLLAKVSDRINENSLIASVIENIPKILYKSEKCDNIDQTKVEEYYEHGEYKNIVYLEKDRPRCQTRDTETQTDISLIEQSKRGRIRRRLSSSSSFCASYKSSKSKHSASSGRSRKVSDSSFSSRSSVSSSSSTSSLRSLDYSSRTSSRLSYSRSRSRSPRYTKKRSSISADREHLNAVEERRIIYVGKISTGTTKEDLRRKFQKFGPINKISLHFRDIGYTHLENYGFVTFKYKEDAHEAYGHGNDDTSYPSYKISFGGRREFCKAAYSDLDNVRDDSYYQSQSTGDSYDKLLKAALENVKKRKV